MSDFMATINNAVKTSSMYADNVTAIHDIVKQKKAEINAENDLKEVSAILHRNKESFNFEKYDKSTFDKLMSVKGDIITNDNISSIDTKLRAANLIDTITDGYNKAKKIGAYAEEKAVRAEPAPSVYESMNLKTTTYAPVQVEAVGDPSQKMVFSADPNSTLSTKNMLQSQPNWEGTKALSIADPNYKSTLENGSLVHWGGKDWKVVTNGGSVEPVHHSNNYKENAFFVQESSGVKATQAVKDKDHYAKVMHEYKIAESDHNYGNAIKVIEKRVDVANQKAVKDLTDKLYAGDVATSTINTTRAALEKDPQFKKYPKGYFEGKDTGKAISNAADFVAFVDANGGFEELATLKVPPDKQAEKEFFLNRKDLYNQLHYYSFAQKERADRVAKSTSETLGIDLTPDDTTSVILPELKVK